MSTAYSYNGQTYLVVCVCVCVSVCVCVCVCVYPESLFGGFALKLVLNAISTGANILKGRVYQNMMINLKVANDKV